MEWNKIVTNAVSALVVATFLGAATIVWKGATSVDTKVQNTRDDMQHLITSLSDKLAGYETQLTTISNQLNDVIRNQTNIVKQLPTLTYHPTYHPEVQTGQMPVEQLQKQQSIYNQLKRKE